jgi:hypothetical protein
VSNCENYVDQNRGASKSDYLDCLCLLQIHIGLIFSVCPSTQEALDRFLLNLVQMLGY